MYLPGGLGLGIGAGVHPAALLQAHHVYPGLRQAPGEGPAGSPCADNQDINDAVVLGHSADRPQRGQGHRDRPVGNGSRHTYGRGGRMVPGAGVQVCSAHSWPVVRELYEVSAGESTLGKSGATHARVNYRQIQMDEAISRYRDSVMPVVSARNGCVGTVVLTDDSTGKIIAISLWESEADMMASQPPGDVDAISGGPPVREQYEVSVQV